MKTLVAIFFGFALFAELHAQNNLRAAFYKADSIAALYPHHSLSDLKTLVDKLTQPLNGDEEKFRAIYRWVCDNIANDHKLFLINKRKREKLTSAEAIRKWNDEFSMRVFKTLLNNQRTVCSGYAYLVKELSAHAGLSCVIVNGYGRTAQANIGSLASINHSWNAVKLNGKWYLCDATWSAGGIDAESGAFIQKFEDCYFLTDPPLFARNHFPIDPSWMLVGEQLTLDAFLNGPLLYKNAFKYNINHLLPETFALGAAKGDPINFHFKNNSQNTIDRIELVINGPSGVTTVMPKVSQDINGVYCINYVFKSKGRHIVHILLNAANTITYTVEVQ